MNSEVFFYIPPSSEAFADKGMLSGKRAAVQCSVAVKGWPTEAGSRALKGFVSLEDATVIERLRLAGAAVVGSTCSSELGFGLHGDCTAEALRACHADVALMADTLGEARLAAACAGLLGFKPSYGRVSRFGLTGMVPSMDCCSILGGNLEDIVSVFCAIEGADPRDPSMGESVKAPYSRVLMKRDATLHVGVVKECMEALDPSELAAFNEGLRKLQGSDIVIREISWEGFNLFPLVHNVVGAVEASSSCGKFDGVRYGHCASGAKNWNEMYLKSREESFGPLLKAYLFQGAYFQFEKYSAFERACRIRAKLVYENQTLMEGLDVLFLPTMGASADALKANTLKEVYDSFTFTLPANVTGQPVLSLSGFSTYKGVELGLQIVGPHMGDEKVFEVAGMLLSRAEGAR